VRQGALHCELRCSSHARALHHYLEPLAYEIPSLRPHAMREKARGGNMMAGNAPGEDDEAAAPGRRVDRRGRCARSTQRVRMRACDRRPTYSSLNDRAPGHHEIA
jgi:hypothetical protein